MVSSDNDLYVGTANPYDGCEVLKNKTIDPRTYGMNANQNWNEFKKNLSEVLGEIEEDYNNILNAFANNNKIN